MCAILKIRSTGPRGNYSNPLLEEAINLLNSVDSFDLGTDENLAVALGDDFPSNHVGDMTMTANDIVMAVGWNNWRIEIREW